MSKVYSDRFIDERFVSHIWNGRYFAGDSLRTKDGRKLEIIYRGWQNGDSGADFREAEIRIDGEIHKGDVEVHVRSSHWRVHHHDANPRYNDIMLHVVMWDDGGGLLTKKQNGEYIPTLVLADYLDRPIGKLWKAIDKSCAEEMPCRMENVNPESIGAILDRAGMERFLSKAGVFSELLEKNTENQVLYEKMMEALGYSRNKKQFLELARRVPLESLIGRSPEETQAILLGVAGLLPSQNGSTLELDEEAERYVSEVEKLWKSFLSQFRGGCMSGEQWEFFRVRPGNFPTRRIAGISYILSKCKNGDRASLLKMFLSAFHQIGQSDYSHKVKEISQILQATLMPRASGYWERHYDFTGNRYKGSLFLIGQNRAADIVINVVLPVVFAYAQRSGEQALQTAVVEIYAKYPKLQDNRVTRHVAKRIFRDGEKHSSVVSSAIRQQGLIHIYKDFCTTRNCQCCPLVNGGS